MRFDRTIVFKGIKQKIDSTLEQGQVNGLNFLLNNFEQYSEFWDDIRQISYALATVFHETAGSFQPVAEGYYLGNRNAPNFYQGNTSRAINFQNSLRYAPYFGRGYVQLTWDYNYKDQTRRIKTMMPNLVKDFERQTGQVFDLLKYPAQAFNPVISFAIMTIGMHFGTFRSGHTLDRYIFGNKCDYIWARYIINGKRKGAKLPDKAEEIASYARRFEAILRIAKIENAKVTIENKEEVFQPEILEGETEFQATSDKQIILANSAVDPATNQPVENPSVNTPIVLAETIQNEQPPILSSLETYGQKVNEISGKGQSSSNNSSSVSSSSVFAVVWKFLLGTISLGIGFAKDNWEWLVIGCIILLVGAWLWNQSKNRATERTIAKLRG